MRKSLGFTLLELLVTMVVISILASMVLFALHRAQQSANIAKTEAIVMKLHNIISRRWESYRTRRIPLPTEKRAGGEILKLTPSASAALRLNVIRQLMRMEMPDRWEDINLGPTDITQDYYEVYGGGTQSLTQELAVPALLEAYRRYFDSISATTAEPNRKPNLQFQNAECLYMIVKVSVMEEGEGLAQFDEGDIGDVDGDGAPEFIDAWGTPIRYLRWPAGFVDDLRQDASSQAPFGHLSDLQPPKAPESASAPFTPCKCDTLAQHDPFDPTGLDDDAYILFPLIYSAGPDRIFDIYSGLEAPPEAVINDPFADVRADADPCGDYDPETPFTVGTPSVGTPKLVGIPKDLPSYSAGDANGVVEHYDNIHNHMIDASYK